MCRWTNGDSGLTGCPIRASFGSGRTGSMSDRDRVQVTVLAPGKVEKPPVGAPGCVVDGTTHERQKVGPAAFETAAQDTPGLRRVDRLPHEGGQPPQETGSLGHVATRWERIHVPNHLRAGIRMPPSSGRRHFDSVKATGSGQAVVRLASALISSDDSFGGSGGRHVPLLTGTAPTPTIGSAGRSVSSASPLGARTGVLRKCCVALPRAQAAGSSCDPRALAFQRLNGPVEERLSMSLVMSAPRC
jgi:hypothetical protein